MTAQDPPEPHNPSESRRSQRRSWLSAIRNESVVKDGVRSRQGIAALP
jgi:hypothetical protein